MSNTDLLEVAKGCKIGVINYLTAELPSDESDTIRDHYIAQIKAASAFEDQQTIYEQFRFSYLLLQTFSQWDTARSFGLDEEAYRAYLINPAGHSIDSLMALVDELGHNFSYNCFFIQLLKTARTEGVHDLLVDFLGNEPSSIVGTIYRRGEFAEPTPWGTLLSLGQTPQTNDRRVLQAHFKHKIKPGKESRAALFEAFATRRM